MNLPGVKLNSLKDSILTGSAKTAFINEKGPTTQAWIETENHSFDQCKNNPLKNNGLNSIKGMGGRIPKLKRYGRASS